MYRLEILIYIDEVINSGSLQNDIKTLIEMNLTEIICNDCVKFQIMAMPGGKNLGGPQAGLIDIVDSLKQAMRNQMLTNLNEKIDQLKDDEAEYMDQINDFQNHFKNRLLR